MDTVVDRYFPVLDRLEIELEKVEEKMFAGVTDSRFNIEALYQLKQKLMRVICIIDFLWLNIHRHPARRLPQCACALLHRAFEVPRRD